MTVLKQNVFFFHGLFSFRERCLFFDVKRRSRQIFVTPECVTLLSLLLKLQCISNLPVDFSSQVLNFLICFYKNSWFVCQDAVIHSSVALL